MNEVAGIRSRYEGMGRIVTERREHLFLISIDRPEKYNGFTPKMCLELAEAYHEYEADPTLRCAVLSAEGDNFTAGLQLGEFDITEPDFFPRELVDPLNLREPFRKKPVIAAVKGICFTIGIELMLAADIVIAEADTRFGQIEVKRGLMAFGGATMRFVERAGWGNAMSLLLTGDEFGVTTASRMGFVQEIVDRGQGRDRAMELARTIARQAPLAVQATRANAAIYEREGPVAAVAAFDHQLKEIAATEDFAEGVQSFIERRDAVFTGR